MTTLLIVASTAPAAGDASRGRVVFALAGGCGCHTPQDGSVGAGGTAIETPFGKFFATNITPDQRTGIGSWSDAEVEQAIRGGYVRGRGAEAPVMPYYRYSGMSDEDLADLIAFLRSLPAVERANQPHQGELPLPRLAYRAWRLLFAPRAKPPSTTPAAGTERGHSVDHVAICGDCHTPRTLGVPIPGLYLAGTADGPGDEKVPNITPHASGIGDWDETTSSTSCVRACCRTSTMSRVRWPTW